MVAALASASADGWLSFWGLVLSGITAGSLGAIGVWVGSRRERREVRRQVTPSNGRTLAEITENLERSAARAANDAAAAAISAKLAAESAAGAEQEAGQANTRTRQLQQDFEYHLRVTHAQRRRSDDPSAPRRPRREST